MANANQLAKVAPAPVTRPAAEHIKAFWAGRSPRQRIYLTAAVGLAIATLLVLGPMIAQPEYKPLMSGLTPQDAQTLATQLTARKIPYKLSPDGSSVSVPASQLDAARLEVAAHDSTRSGRMGFEIFDKVSWGQTEFNEKVNYQRALEGELERTIESISNVRSARVHLVMPEDSIFLDQQRSAKASVTLQLKNGSLSRDEIASVQRLVAGAVQELKPSDVVLVDADSGRSLSASNGLSMGDDDVQQSLTQRIISTLAPVVGEDHLRATVNVEYDSSSSEQSQEKYDPTVSVPLTMQHSEETATNGSLPSGVVGTSSNVPGARSGSTATTGSSGQSSKSETATYGVNRTTLHVVQPAGRIKRITAAVVVDDAVDRKLDNGKWVESRHPHTPEQMKLISDLAQAAIGFDAARGDTVSVQNLAFATAAPESIPAPGKLDKARRAVEDYASVLRYAALLGLFVAIYLLVLRPIQKKALSAAVALPQPSLPAEAESSALPEAPENLARRALALKQQLAEFVRTEPENSTTAVRAWLREDKA